MGHVRVVCRLRGTTGELALPNMLVDTGATYTVLPPDINKQIGLVEAPWSVEMELADGRAVSGRVGMVEMEVEGRRSIVLAVVLPAAEPLLGVQALEALGLRVNPTTNRLEPTRPSARLLAYEVK